MELEIFDILRLIKYALEHDNPQGALGLVNSILDRNAPLTYWKPSDPVWPPSETTP